MNARDITPIKKIKEELLFMERALNGVSRENFLANELLQHAMTMSLITIGECANHLSDTFIDEHPQIQWTQIIAVRNIAAHGYWQLNMEQIWQALITDIPELQEYLDSI